MRLYVFAVALAFPLTSHAVCPTGSLTHCSLSATVPLFECDLPNATESSEAYFWLDDGKICVRIDDGGTTVSTEVLDYTALTVQPSSTTSLRLRVNGTGSDDLIQFWNPSKTTSLGDPYTKGLIAMAYGLGGDDELIGGDGDLFSYFDELFGGDGDDVIFTHEGPDFVDGGDDDDRIVGDDWPQIIYGSDGNDVIWDGDGEDEIYGDDPNDNSASGHDKINGGDDQDYIWGGPGNDQLCGDDFSVLTGTNTHNEWLYGGAGTDCLAAGTGGPSGGLGYDQRIICGAGTDTYQGGSFVTPDVDCENEDSTGIAFCDDSSW